MRVFLDTNVLISYLLVTQQSAISFIVEAAYTKQFTLLVSVELLEELVETVSTKKRLAQRITPLQVEELVSSLLDTSELLPPITESIPSICRDPKDDYLLAYALLGEADYLISGDDDLVSLGDVEGVKIMKPADFLTILRR